MADNLYFVSGLPRSGSTLLMNLLGQNPNHHVTPTSGLINLFCSVTSSWKGWVEFKAEGLEKVQPRVENACKGLLAGYFAEELRQNKVCFDKSRGWLQYIEDLQVCLKRPIKVIATVRDVRAILASFEKLYRKRGIDYEYPVGEAYHKAQTVVGRCENLLAGNGIVGITVQRLRDALARVPNAVEIIPFRHLTESPREIMGVLHDRLGLEKYDYDPTKVEQVTYENDVWHGMNLHVIRPEIKPSDAEPWKGILPDEYAAEIASRYKDINTLANA